MIAVARPGLVLCDLDATVLSRPTKLAAGYLGYYGPEKMFGERSRKSSRSMRQVQYLIAGCKRRRNCD